VMDGPPPRQDYGRMTDPRSDPTHPKIVEGDDVLKPSPVDDVTGHASVLGPDGDPKPTPEAEDPEGADD
jgi:hypothetical protein